MTKNEFKQGDRVRFTGDYDHYVESTLEKGDEYAVTYVDSVGNCDLSVPCTAYSINAEDLELVEPLDRRTAFLSELSELLRKYDAEIHDGEMYYISIDIDANSENKQEINYNLSEMDKWWLDADNIMDFDKE